MRCGRNPGRAAQTGGAAIAGLRNPEFDHPAPRRRDGRQPPRERAAKRRSTPLAHAVSVVPHAAAQSRICSPSRRSAPRSAAVTKFCECPSNSESSRCVKPARARMSRRLSRNAWFSGRYSDFLAGADGFLPATGCLRCEPERQGMAQTKIHRHCVFVAQFAERCLELPRAQAHVGDLGHKEKQ